MSSLSLSKNKDNKNDAVKNNDEQMQENRNYQRKGSDSDLSDMDINVVTTV